MRWSVIRLIAFREMRDLLRDRRTVMVLLVLPAVLYPFFILASLLFAWSITDRPTRVGIVGIDQLPAASKAPTDYPPLLVDGKFPELERDPEIPDDLDPGKVSESDLRPIEVVPLTEDPKAAMDARKVDVVLVVPEGFVKDLEANRKPTIQILERDGDERSKLAARRLRNVIKNWKEQLRKTKLARHHLPPDFDTIFQIDDNQTKKPAKKKAADEIRDSFARIFPFILILWLVAGAIQPAMDLTAGEKERGTMETLLISPAERSEIVAGKFLATTSFAFASVIWNCTWLTGGAIGLGAVLGYPIVHLPGLAGCLLLGIPLAMFFSAICLALGVFARSAKEGQYYLMPLILVTMPLAFWGMLPGTELTVVNSLIPVTGAILLQQKLLTVSSDPVPWEYLPLVLGGLFVDVAIALALAIRQFKNESVLFRETGGDKVGLLSRIFRRKS